MDDVWEEIDGDGLCGLYQLVWIFRHQHPTESFPELRERAKSALDTVRAARLGVEPRCPFFASYIRRHKAYADLVVGP